MKNIKRLLALCALILAVTPSIAQVRIAMLPFRNMDGEISRNVWSLQLADSLQTELVNLDPTQTKFVFIPADSIEMAISELNLDPTNPQYESDMWKAVAALGAQLVIQGNFLLQGERVLINAYVYDIDTKMSNQDHQAKNLFKTPSTYLSAVPVMARKLHPALMQ